MNFDFTEIYNKVHYKKVTYFGQIDRKFLDESLDLLLVETSEAKHADLISDMLPIVLGTLFFKIVDKSSSHGDNAISH